MIDLINKYKLKLKKLFKKDWQPGPFPFQDINLSFEERVDDLVSRMTIKEKSRQMQSRSPEILRLGVPKYHWWNECLHGVGRAGLATVFPQATGMGATFNPELIYDVACAISDEARAKHHDALHKGNVGKQYYGLTYWSPNINIFRDPRWGRGQETYGEDPYLMSQIGINFVKGLQGNDSKYLKLVATPKHYIVHSGPEGSRHEFNAIASQKDIRETYLYAFKECVQKANAYSIMGAYNRTNGELCCASPTFLQKILRDEIGFKGFVVSDCGAIRDFHAHHKITNNRYESAAMGVKEGCDLNCGFMYRFLPGAFKRKLITEEEIDVALKRLMLARMKLGMFDPEEIVPFSKIPYDVVDSEEHRQLALRAALESIVLLKNDGSLLPIKPQNIKKVAVIGPNSDDEEALWGNYNGTPSYTITPLKGIKKALPNSEVLYEQGCKIIGGDDSGFESANSIAKSADLIILCLGISNKLEGEQKFRGKDDRDDILLPDIQSQLMKSIVEENPDTPIVLIIINGSPVATPWAEKNIPAIIEAWYGGQEAGNAIADVLFGKYSPSGKMPITVPFTTKDLPDFEDYNMKGRTYRYLDVEPLYPFGYGLSYGDIEYSDFKITPVTINTNDFPEDKIIELSVIIKNTSDFDVDEVVQIYIKDLIASVDVPIYSLRGVKRINLNANSNSTIKFNLTLRDFALINEEGECILEPGKFLIYVGSQQPDPRSQELSGRTPLSVGFEVTGKNTPIKY